MVVGRSSLAVWLAGLLVGGNPAGLAALAVSYATKPSGTYVELVRPRGICMKKPGHKDVKADNSEMGKSEAGGGTPARGPHPGPQPGTMSAEQLDHMRPQLYSELCVTSNFTFLTGASHPEELVIRAAELGLEAIAITDHNSLAGVVRAFSALKELQRESTELINVRSSQRINPSSRQPLDNPDQPGMARPDRVKLPRLIVGARLVLMDSALDWVVLPTDRAAYQRLTRLLTLGKRRAEKGACHLTHGDMLEACSGMMLIALPQQGLGHKDVAAHIREAVQRFPGMVFLGAAPAYNGSDQQYFDACATLAYRLAAPMVAVGDVLMHQGKRRQLADVLTCMRTHITIDAIGSRALAQCGKAPEGRCRYGAALSSSSSGHPAGQ